LSFTADLDAVEGRLNEIERSLDASAEPQVTRLRDELEGELLALRGFVAFRRHQIPQAIALMQRAQPRLSPKHPHMQAMNLHHLGLALRLSHDPTAAAQAFSEAVTIFSGAAKTPSYAVYPLKNLGMIEEAQGRLRQAQQFYRRALEHAVVGDRPLPSAGHAYLCLGRLQYEWDELPAAADELRQAIELGRQGELHQVIAEAAIELAPVVLALGAADEVDAVVQQAQEAAHRWNDPGLIRRANVAAARVRLMAGRTTAAAAWAEQAQLDLDALVEAEPGHLTFARLLLAQGRLDEARELLQRLATHAEARGQLRSALEALALLSVAQQGAGDARAALATLEHALRRAEPEGYIRTFLDAGPSMAVLLAAGLERGDWGRAQGDPAVRDYARTLLERVPAGPAPVMPSTPPPTILPPDVEPLTPRELEVLRLIAAGKSNGEIAGIMVVAVSTVKAHINSIFGKLGVASRTQALVRARALHLL
ncbi:MAG TPA: LuxR C-terminal-related transcriptional regulator, partial [Herpetosiphonaceae bacterium]|nr:LuxR C-terminal-related transcriptional regulator [Herpetosiphonaceae bacterium]